MHNIESLKLVLLKSDFKALKEALDCYNINETDKFGNNILHYYIKESGHLKLDYKAVIDLILSKGLDINAKQTEGPYKRSPLNLAVTLTLKEIADYLIKEGADINSTDANGNSVLWAAVMWYRGDGFLIKRLIESGADVNQKNDAGISPIKLAKSIENYDADKFFPR
ncbi:MAG TPA: ankyrin repeat domain-containing protein [Chitinophaga sp.]|uniref:ankyrin repeat domain-containing protein n=1 Tax=Chitinophaga sp. TaxID=1869181 RepID=UPI002B59BEC8|nr:ankyrin repeat domain-containing protein [Chitinophaga sp.]HVI47545.1 ankyrin repeat domain-containing protein [Chitinophaga sp.]